MPAWSPQEDAALLAAIIKTSQPKIDYPAVAAHMKSRTAYAIEHRIRKLQTIANPDGGTNGARATGETATKRKRGPNGTAKKRKKTAPVVKEEKEEFDEDVTEVEDQWNTDRKQSDADQKGNAYSSEADDGGWRAKMQKMNSPEDDEEEEGLMSQAALDSAAAMWGNGE